MAVAAGTNAFQFQKIEICYRSFLWVSERFMEKEFLIHDCVSLCLLEGLLTVMLCCLLVGLNGSHDFYLVVLLATAAISSVGSLLYLCWLPRSVPTVYFMVLCHFITIILYFSCVINFNCNSGSIGSTASSPQYLDQHLSHVSAFNGYLA